MARNKDTYPTLHNTGADIHSGLLRVLPADAVVQQDRQDQA